MHTLDKPFFQYLLTVIRYFLCLKIRVKLTIELPGINLTWSVPIYKLIVSNV